MSDIQRKDNPETPYLPEFRSDDSLTRWPAVNGDMGTMLSALLHQLDASQWWSAAELAAQQSIQLRELLAHAVTTVPFYGSLFTDGDATMAVGSAETWRTLPILTRTEVQAQGQRLFSDPAPPAHGMVTTSNTSGSTGRPITVRTTEVGKLMLGAFTLRALDWHRRDPGRKLAVIHLSRLYRLEEGHAAHADWGWPVAAVYRTGTMVQLAITTPFAEQLRWLRQEQPDYLLTIPSNLRGLLELSAQQRFRPRGLREVATVAEVVDDDLRELCAEAWGATLTDTYSAQEAGCIAVQCPEQPHYHVMSEGVLLEVLDDAGRPCGPGETGRVVVTPLHNFAMPFIRYELGDHAEVGGPCPCGRGLPVLNRIIGRARELWRLPDGRRFWPSLPRSRFTRTAPILQHQFVQTAVDEMEAHLVVARPLTGAEETALRDMFRARLPAPFRIRFVYRDQIPRSPGGKFEYFRCKVD